MGKGPEDTIFKRRYTNGRQVTWKGTQHSQSLGKYNSNVCEYFSPTGMAKIRKMDINKHWRICGENGFPYYNWEWELYNFFRKAWPLF